MPALLSLFYLLSSPASALQIIELRGEMEVLKFELSQLKAQLQPPRPQISSNEVVEHYPPLSAEREAICQKIAAGSLSGRSDTRVNSSVLSRERQSLLKLGPVPQSVWLLVMIMISLRVRLKWLVPGECGEH